MGNNRYHRAWGAESMYFQRLSPAEYADGKGSPAGVERQSPRLITSKLLNQGDTSVFIEHGQSSFICAWAQFLGHDIALISDHEPKEPLQISIPSGDPQFDSASAGNRVIPINRSEYVMHFNGTRQQINKATSFIDGSMIYGSDSLRANALRLHDGTGRLRTSNDNLLPFNSYGFENLGSNGSELFLAGDPRANQNIILIALHTLFVREHNFWCNIIQSVKPDLTDCQIYNQARAMVIAEIQAITYKEFLPALLGPDPLPAYSGYNPNINPTVSNEFATAIYCAYHSMQNKEVLRIGSDLEVISQGNLSLSKSYFNVPAVIFEGNIDPILRGLCYQQAERIDLFIVDELRNSYSFSPVKSRVDLAAIDIQRGRDHGLCDYNQFRKAIGLDPVISFNSISSDTLFCSRMAKAYSSINDMDIWPTVLAEDHIIGSSVGITLYKVMKRQFQLLRDGDRFWYQSYLSPYLIRLIERRNLSQIIVTNTGIGRYEIPKNVFYAARLEDGR